MLDGIWQDLRYSLRLMRKSRLLTVSVILTLALGIGANSLVFSVVRAVILRPLNYANSDRLVQLWESGKLIEGDWVSYPNFQDWAKQAQSFTSMAAYVYYATTLSGDKEPEQFLGVEVTGKLFEVLGAKPFIGRTFVEGEDQPGHDPVVVISYSLWQRRYGGDPGIAGHQVDIGGRTHTIIGIMPASFHFPSDVPSGTSSVPIEAWIGGSRRPDLESRGSHNFWAVARLKPGVSLRQAQTEMDAIASKIAVEFPGTNKDIGITVAYLQDHVTGGVRPALLMLLTSVGLLLLLACANIANLLLARAESRRREMAIREAIGAGRSRLIRQTLTESTVLSFFGAAAGLALVYVSLESLLKWAPADIPRIQQTAIDPAVLLFTAAAAMVAGILFGLAPAVIAGESNVHQNLKRSGSRSSPERATAIRQFLIAGQVALAVMLLVGAGLLARSLINVTQLDLGFRPDRTLMAFLNLTGTRYTDAAQQTAFFENVLRRVRTVPGVESAALSNSVPLSGLNDLGNLRIEGMPEPPPGQDRPEANRPHVSPGYFETMGIQLVQGRLFDDHDGARSAKVAVISDLAARKYWPNQNPIGKRLAVGSLKDGQPAWREIVGVVRSTRHFGLEASQKAEVYLPSSQLPEPLMILVLRVRGDMDTVIRAVRTEIASVDAQQAFAPLSIEDMVLGSGARRRFETFLLFGFALLAAFLATVGIYGVAAYSVTQRGREIGIRLALGARPADVVLMFAKQGMFTIGIGVIIGIVAAAAMTKAVTSLLFGISPLDLPTFAAVLAIVLPVAILSTYLPSRRASRVDPVVVLMDE
jgi:putative ABC transport system permease protein